MKLHSCRLWRILPLLCLGSLALSARAELPGGLADNWYRSEVLIFVRDTASNSSTEQWDPLPELSYPASFRYLLDPTMADRRLKESLAYASRIDARGVQSLIVPAPIEELLDHTRPDAITTPLVDLDVLIPEDQTPANASAQNLENADDPVPAASEGSRSDPAHVADDALQEPDADSPIIALAYELLDDGQLDFRPQARSLRRQGHQVLFHGTWWAQLDDADETPAVIIDRSGDMDSLDWPALQGSLQIYRSRYLHIAVDLWLNTQGDYLPEGWQIPAPPLTSPSVTAETLRGKPMLPWAPPPSTLLAPVAPGIPLLSQNGGLAQTPAQIDVQEDAQTDIPSDTQTNAQKEERVEIEYPWHHAITHRQTRRMRSGEIHYLDHPVIGVIVKITPLSDEELPLLPPVERDFRERHALPVDLLPDDSDSNTAGNL